MLLDHFSSLKMYFRSSGADRCWDSYIPKEPVQVSVPHVLKHHRQRLPVGTNAVESYDVLVLQHRQQLRLPLEVLPGRLVGVFKSLRPNKKCWTNILNHQQPPVMNAIKRYLCDRKIKSESVVIYLKGVVFIGARVSCYAPAQKRWRVALKAKAWLMGW